MSKTAQIYSHYYRNVEHLKKVDVYRLLLVFDVADPCLQHAIKKLMAAGRHGAKDFEKDIREAIVTLERRLEMSEEDKDGALLDQALGLPEPEEGLAQGPVNGRLVPYIPDMGEPLARARKRKPSAAPKKRVRGRR